MIIDLHEHQGPITKIYALVAATGNDEQVIMIGFLENDNLVKCPIVNLHLEPIVKIQQEFKEMFDKQKINPYIIEFNISKRILN